MENIVTEVKMIFVQANEKDCSKLGHFLGSLQQHEYYFVILPPDTKVLTKDEVIELLQRVVN